MQIGTLIDCLVQKINASEHEPLPDNEISEELRRPQSDKYDWHDWQICPAHDLERITCLEEKMGFQFPPSFRSLVTRYRFPGFELGPVWLYANTGAATFFELSDRLFRDEIMSRILLGNGFIQFGNPYDQYHYDAVCFDTRRAKQGDEFLIVQLDHEEILMRERIQVVAEIAPSLVSLVESFFKRIKASIVTSLAEAWGTKWLSITL